MDSFIYTTPDKDVVVTLLLKTLTHLHPYLRTRRTKRITRDGLAREFRLLPLVKSPYCKTLYFEVYEDSKHHEYAVCKTCFTPEVEKGGVCKWEVKVGASHSTSKLQAHLRVHHKDEYLKNLRILQLCRIARRVLRRINRTR